VSDVRWLTYAELGEALHIGRESARQLAKRRRWARQQGNDGQARVGVPVEDLEARIEARAEAQSEPQDEAPAEPQDEPRNDPGVIVLTNHIDRLERELEAVKVERDAERATAARLAQQVAKIEVLEMLVEAERKRVEDVSADRENWRAQAERLAIAPPVAAPVPVPDARGWWPWRRRA
jgi:small-conductance mechanosensitive channel